MPGNESARSEMPALLKKEWPVVVILLVYLVLAVIYGVVTPIFEAPDEPQHFLFIKHLADGKGLPVQGKEGQRTWAQEGSQPPLYYALAALLISGLETDEVESLLWRNPHANMGVPLREGNKNIYIHTEQERFPYHGAVLAVHLVRLLSTLMGAGTVLATYKIMRLVFSEEPAIAIGATALHAFTPQFIFISAAVNNDNLVVLLCSWTLWMLIRLWVRPLTWRSGLGLGLLIGGASLAKLSGLGLVLILMITLTTLWWRGRPWQKLLLVGGVAAMTMLAVAGWWYVRNLRLYGDITGLNAMLAIFGRRQVTPGIAALLREAEGLRISYWAIFGWFNILSAPILYKLLDILLLIAGAGFLLRCFRRLRARASAENLADNKELPLVWAALAVAWVVIMLGALVRWTRMTSGTQGRLLFPAIAAISGLVFRGLVEWIPRGYRPHLAFGLGGLMFLWAALCPFAHIAPAYAQPPILSLADIPADAHPVHITYGNQLELIAYTFEESAAAPGKTVHVIAYWQALAPLEQDYSIYVHLLGRDGQVIGQTDTYPGNGTYPTRLWRIGQVIQDRYPVPVSSNALTPVLAQVEIGAYALEVEEGYSSLKSLEPMADGQGQPLESPLVGRLRIAARHPIRYEVMYPASFIFGEQIALIGYDLNNAAARAYPGETVGLTLYWQALRPPERDYTVFVHLVGADNEMAGQQDSQPVNGDYPTHVWLTGEVIRDMHTVQIKPETAAGEYEIVVGLYVLETGERLPVKGEGDHIRLAPIIISW